MAIDRHRSDALKTLLGRQLGLDHNGFIVSVDGLRNTNERVTSASTLSKGGTSLVAGATANYVHTLTAPSARMVGVKKTVVNDSTGTGAFSNYVKLNGGAFSYNGAVDNTVIEFSSGGRGANVTLEYITTGLVAVLGRSSTSLVLLATST